MLLSGLNLMVMRAVERPTAALSQAAMRVAAGDLHARVRLAQSPMTIGDNDELGHLADCFNQMADRLSELCANLEAEVAARTAELETTAELARAASSSLRSSSIVRQATRIIKRRLGTRIPGLHHVGVYAIEADTDEAVLIEAVGDGREQWPRKSRRVPLGAATPIGLAVSTRRLQVLPNARLAMAPVKPPLLLDTSSAATAPLVVGAEVVGVLSLESKEADAFGPETMDLLATVADQLATGVHNANQFERQRYAAQHCVDHDRAKSELMRATHLELRVPVDTVKRLSERLLRLHDERLCDARREDLRRIRVSAERLQGIVDALGDLYLLDLGDVALRPEPVNVRDAIERAVVAAAPLLEAKENSLLTDLHSAPSTIRADRSALRQIVLGLLATAAGVGEAGCIEVRARSVEVFYDDSDCQDPLLLVTVSHPAARVPREELARLCQGPVLPEGQDSDQSSVPVGPGFPMAKRLVEMQGGRIWAENGNGTGMSFSFILPVEASRTGGARDAGLHAPSRERGEDACAD